MDDILFFFLLVIVFLNIFYLINSSLDWDTSNHLYYAKLRSRKVFFKSSYKIGVKIFLPYIYSIIWPLIEGNLKFYRLVNILCFLGTFFLLTKNLIFDQNLLLISFVIICLNISLFNPQTSATEFISTLFIILMMDLNYSNPLPFYYLLIFFLIISILFKINEMIYIFPYLIQFKLNNEFLTIIFILIVTIFFGYFVFFKKKVFTSIKN